MKVLWRQFGARARMRLIFQVVREWGQKAQLAPETLQVGITYRIPEPVVNSVGAGVGFEPTTFGL